MSSYFSWVDFAEEDRKKMMDVVHLFKEQDTRDELGIGTIRDAFADYFFPGTSTIQTRARYFLFIPWIYQSLEQKKVKSMEIEHRLKKEEVKLIHCLLKKENDDTYGVIGKQEQDRLQRFPSNIYWSGLGSWGIRTKEGSQSQYHYYLDTFYRQKKFMVKNDDKELISNFSEYNWHPGLPKPPTDFLKSANLKLTPKEAQYLQDRISVQNRNSLLSHLVSCSKFERVDFFWNLPIPIMDSLSETLNKDVQHAHNFSETMLGAALLYNLMLSQAQKNEAFIENYHNQLNDWVNIISYNYRWEELIEWYKNFDFFWKSTALEGARIPHTTKIFIREWYQIIFNKSRIDSIAENKDAQDLIFNREIHLKRNRARLNNPRALEKWNGTAGNRQLDFRWGIAQDIVNDILNGLTGE